MTKRWLTGTTAGAIMIAMMLAACQSSTEKPLVPEKPRPVAADARPIIIDTDMAADDWLAILYLLQHPQADVQAIAVTGAGEARCDAGVRNALDLLALAGRPEIPVACGRETPLRGDHVFPIEWRDRVDRLLGLSLPRNERVGVTEGAVPLISLLIRESPFPVHLIALGPVTNVAEMLEAEPALAANLRAITIMGGAVHVPGNVGPSSPDIDNDVAEWNIYVDPHALAVVFASGVPVTLVPLDATDQAQVTEDFVKRLKKDRSTSVAEFVYRVLGKQEEDIRAGYRFFWDPLAAAVALDSSLAPMEEMHLTVVEEEGPHSGQTPESDGGHPVQVAVGADQARFESLFLDALNGRLR
jgi:pyrimidine-specific ribonucleoside hydrolase